MTGAPKETRTKVGPLPGDLGPKEMIERMVRVDHAGEYGAVRIYEGQLSVLGQSKNAPVLKHMLEQEEEHLDTFNKLIAERRVRPTALLPIWHVAGFVLGAGTALLGERAAMACTVAVEEVIDEHYTRQIDSLAQDKNINEPELSETFETFRAEELEHRQTALDHEAEKAPGYDILTGAVKGASRFAIWLSERV